jgi:ATP-dependent Clp protease ATP-binding subunit ClpB
VFHPLDEAQIANIARIQLRHLEQRLAKMDIRLEVEDAALRVVAAAGFDPVYGARPLKRAIQQQIENPLAREILAGRYGPGDTVRVTATLGEIGFAKADGEPSGGRTPPQADGAKSEKAKDKERRETA